MIGLADCIFLLKSVVMSMNTTVLKKLRISLTIAYTIPL